MQSDVDRKLMSWRASARSKPDLEEFNILSDMQWERVLEASIPVDFKLKLWKSKSIMKDRRWSLDDALLSLDFEHNKQKCQVDSMITRKKASESSYINPPIHTLKSKNDFVQQIISTPEDQALKRGSALLVEMKSYRMAPDVKFFNTLIATCVGKNAKRGIQTSPSDPFQVSNPSSTQAVRRAVARSASQRWSDCTEVLRTMRDHGVSPDVVTLNILVESCVKCSDKGLSRLQNVQKACRLLHTFEADLNIKGDVVSLSTILNGCATVLKDVSDKCWRDVNYTELVCANLRIVEWTLQKMAKEGIVPNIVTFVSLHEIVLYALILGPTDKTFKDQTIKFCSSLSVRMRSFQVVPNGFLLNSILKAMVLASKSQLGTEYAQLAENMISSALSQGAQPDIVSYNILLQSLLNMRNLRRNSRTAYLERKGVSPDIVTFSIFLNICSSTSLNDIDFLTNSVKILDIMRVLGVKPNCATTSAYISGHSSDSPRTSIARGLQAIAFLVGKGAKPSRSWYLDLVRLAVNLNQVLYIAAQLRKYGFAPDLAFYTIPFHNFCARGDVINLASAWALLLQMQLDGVPFDSGFYRTIFKAGA
ncbi:hypothetical protein GUITHDRAFT_109290 [Guillardia theta CCMP2712]|uniref:Pentacotripeptide-repeat region of PRORP domain-containing protein n=2 Tax=Guillardia theta TaxID=55529 RepID=L1J9U1_GUITC|nr:hypothetical protein GUITHDRAFT_109290 [Guillardia theta CCMP2712]EKX44869.1 hypothetical protein GUITHDRAFT_109290 [Guillardia theta CCMP2712]|eukprot:XP_005831849.1 hypothetical protein GUITHDRAFT_109290 [Guillardia theta CCMP2712]